MENGLKGIQARDSETLGYCNCPRKKKSKAEAAGEDGGSRSAAGLDRGAAAQRAATQEGHYQVSTGPRFRFGTRGGGAAGLVRLRDASPPRRSPYIPYSSVPPPSSSLRRVACKAGEASRALRSRAPAPPACPAWAGGAALLLGARRQQSQN